MNTTAKSVRRPIVALNLPKNVSSLVTQAESIVKAMTQNPAFPSPLPLLGVATDALQQLQAAQIATLSRAIGAVPTRDERRASLVQVLQQLRAQVQAAADASPTNARSIIQSAGMAVKATAVFAARTFAATPGAVSGSVRLRARAASKRASYDWQYSPDAGKTWISVPGTLRANTVLSGLSPGATVAFRYRALTKDGEGDWSQLATLMVT